MAVDVTPAQQLSSHHINHLGSQTPAANPYPFQ
jgi:hypothetical protein